MFNLKTISTEKFNLNNSLKVFFQDQTQILFQEHSLREVSIQEQTGIFNFKNTLTGKFQLRTEYNFNFKNKLEVFFSRTVWKVSISRTD